MSCDVKSKSELSKLQKSALGRPLHIRECERKKWGVRVRSDAHVMKGIDVHGMNESRGLHPKKD